MQYKYDTMCSLLCQLGWTLYAYTVIHVDQRGIQVPTRILARVKSQNVVLGPGGNLHFQFSDPVLRCQTVWSECCLSYCTNKMITVKITLKLKLPKMKVACSNTPMTWVPHMKDWQPQRKRSAYDWKGCAQGGRGETGTRNRKSVVSIKECVRLERGRESRKTHSHRPQSERVEWIESCWRQNKGQMLEELKEI